MQFMFDAYKSSQTWLLQVWGTWRETPVYSFDALQPGHSLAGPAIIEAETTTVLLDTGDRVSVNELGWLDITLR